MKKKQCDSKNQTYGMSKPVWVKHTNDMEDTSIINFEFKKYLQYYITQSNIIKLIICGA